jgi:hypothetical protein
MSARVFKKIEHIHIPKTSDDPEWETKHEQVTNAYNEILKYISHNIESAEVLKQVYTESISYLSAINKYPKNIKTFDTFIANAHAMELALIEDYGNFLELISILGKIKSQFASIKTEFENARKKLENDDVFYKIENIVFIDRLFLKMEQLKLQAGRTHIKIDTIRNIFQQMMRALNVEILTYIGTSTLIKLKTINFKNEIKKLAIIAGQDGTNYIMNEAFKLAKEKLVSGESPIMDDVSDVNILVNHPKIVVDFARYLIKPQEAMEIS